MENKKTVIGYSVRIRTHAVPRKRFMSDFVEKNNKDDILYGEKYFDFSKLENAENKFLEFLKK